MKSLLFVSVSVLCTVTFTEKALAGLSLPNIGECRRSATDREAMDYCAALEDCIKNHTDDRASLKGCILEAQDAYTAKAMQGEGMSAPTSETSTTSSDTEVFRWADVGVSAPAPEDFPIETQEVNSELVEGIQGEKGWTQQQQGPND